MADNALKKRNALADLGQGVSRGFWADGLGGPVDMMTTLANLGIAGGGYAGHKLGLLSQPPELIQNPTGGSEWIAQKMRSAGLLNDNPGSTADNYGRVAGGLLAPLTAARAPQIANALQQAPAALQRGAYAVGEKAAGMAENHLVRQGAIQPATVWHGTPHKFDKFDASKIGTGEGSQAYGHGLYLAESPEVSRSYSVIAQKPGLRQGTAVGSDGGVVDSLIMLNARKYTGGDVGKLAELVKSRPGAFAKPDQMLSRMADFVDNQPPAYMYKVDLPDDQIARMLDWDKPLSQQAPGVRSAVSPMLDRMKSEALQPAPGWGDLQGASPDVDALLRQLLKGGPETAAELRARGIPGIRYLDGGSRTAGKGSSNFVVFPGNEGLLSILERNGQPLK
jgi:hypothetical protein